ncbi:MAG: hypothetical protein OEW93_01755 [Candidatus Bathyarchaeota archaeon]|nr:hypothetical protein [Candidatus Bathyarchaeota archaeon]MDH5791298.1 hypothetical protein [Candidatus Bathyarchaeota archaeon]
MLVREKWMADLQTIQAISQVMTAVGVVAAASYYILMVRNTIQNQQLTLETRQAQLFMQVYDRWNSSEFIKFWFEFIEADFEEYELGIDRELDIAIRAIGRFLEGIGVLLKRDLIDVALVDDLMSGNIVDFWEKSEELVNDFRTLMGYPQYGEWAEYLYNKIKPIVEEQHPELKT